MEVSLKIDMSERHRTKSAGLVRLLLWHGVALQQPLRVQEEHCISQ